MNLGYVSISFKGNTNTVIKTINLSASTVSLRRNCQGKMGHSQTGRRLWIYIFSRLHWLRLISKFIHLYLYLHKRNSFHNIYFKEYQSKGKWQTGTNGHRALENTQKIGHPQGQQTEERFWTSSCTWGQDWTLTTPASEAGKVREGARWHRQLQSPPRARDSACGAC